MEQSKIISAKEQTEEKDIHYMRRCIQLALNGMRNVKPNPMVGALLVCNDRIIGEGYHVRFGERHAEVNCFSSVKPADEYLLPQSTLYVSLEPCSHYGKTPPCADLIIRKGVRRVVVGCIDPFAQVRGRGIHKLREAGIDVSLGVLEKECLALNKRFIIYNTRMRPYIILKWAQTINGFIDNQFRTLSISTPFTKMLSHKLRAESDAILVGRVTDEREHPLLNVRHWSGPDPMRIVLDHRQNIVDLMTSLYEKKVQSLIVEGGTKTLQSFLTAGLWDEIRVEMAPLTVKDGTPAPHIPTDIRLIQQDIYDRNIISVFARGEN